MHDHLADIEEPLPTVQPLDKSVNLSDLVESVKQMAQAMQARLMDDNGHLKKDIPIREGKEAISSISTLLGMILRNKDALENKHYQQQYDAAVISVLEEMDEVYQTEFLSRLQEKLDSVEAA